MGQVEARKLDQWQMLALNDSCPCGHNWEEHNREDGCMAGWVYDSEGLVRTEGCMCQLAHTERSA